jgi:hypothetical protein
VGARNRVKTEWIRNWDSLGIRFVSSLSILGKLPMGIGQFVLLIFWIGFFRLENKEKWLKIDSFIAVSDLWSNEAGKGQMFSSSHEKSVLEMAFSMIFGNQKFQKKFFCREFLGFLMFFEELMESYFRQSSLLQ